MLQIIFGVFIVLHGLVHLLYFGQSRRLFELQPGMVWPDGSWLFARVLDAAGNRVLATIFLVWAALDFVAAGIGIFAGQAWFRPVLAGTAVFSSAIFILFWDGGWQNLDDKGGVGLLINVAILIAVFVLHWPKIA
ncbi:MAG: hypothetical protein CL608_08260 [Anaerolineaceae bacterium]|nr:hypothetical protein [Anaerolineaceae bacterium]